MDRQHFLQKIRERKEPWDIVIIGGGATGAGCALDAASRGFDVLLIEQSDFGKGTSSRSTKLIHGGVRYLAQGNISLVREALKERGLLLKNAPHVVHKQTFVVPCYSYWRKAFYGVGLKIYDLLAGKLNFGSSRFLNKAETLQQLPNLEQKGLVGGILYFDGQFDDTRLLIDILRTAAENGATVVNYLKASSFIKDGLNKIAGILLEDSLSGEVFEVSAKCVINATGAFCDSVRRLSDPTVENMITPSQGVHLVFDKNFSPTEVALVIPKTSDGRILFIIPWHGHLLVGTTDTPIKNVELEPLAQESEIKFILETAAEYLANPPTRQDIKSVFTGIRPLVRSSKNASTSSLSRSHELSVDQNNLITITGGKWTTYRHMAEETIDLAVKTGGLQDKKCITETLAISTTTKFDQDNKLLHPQLIYTRTDILRAVREEMAQTIEDVLARRTRALFINVEAAIEIAPEVAKIMSVELKKDEEWINSQVHQFTQTAASYLP